jgi:hypothetical protein
MTRVSCLPVLNAVLERWLVPSSGAEDSEVAKRIVSARAGGGVHRTAPESRQPGSFDVRRARRADGSQSSGMRFSGS